MHLHSRTHCCVPCTSLYEVSQTLARDQMSAETAVRIRAYDMQRVLQYGTARLCAGGSVHADVGGATVTAQPFLLYTRLSSRQRHNAASK
jgi:hypothetical protein